MALVDTQSVPCFSLLVGPWGLLDGRSSGKGCISVGGFPRKECTWLQNKTEQAPLVLDLKSKAEVPVLATNDSSSILYFFFF